MNKRTSFLASAAAILVTVGVVGAVGNGSTQQTTPSTAVVATTTMVPATTTTTTQPPVPIQFGTGFCGELVAEGFNADPDNSYLQDDHLAATLTNHGLAVLDQTSYDAEDVAEAVQTAAAADISLGPGAIEFVMYGMGLGPEYVFELSAPPTDPLELIQVVSAYGDVKLAESCDRLMTLVDKASEGELQTFGGEEDDEQSEVVFYNALVHVDEYQSLQWGCGYAAPPGGVEVLQWGASAGEGSAVVASFAWEFRVFVQTGECPAGGTDVDGAELAPFDFEDCEHPLNANSPQCEEAPVEEVVCGPGETEYTDQDGNVVPCEPEAVLDCNDPANASAIECQDPDAATPTSVDTQQPPTVSPPTSIDVTQPTVPGTPTPPGPTVPGTPTPPGPTVPGTPTPPGPTVPATTVPPTTTPPTTVPPTTTPPTTVPPTTTPPTTVPPTTTPPTTVPPTTTPPTTVPACPDHHHWDGTQCIKDDTDPGPGDL